MFFVNGHSFEFFIAQLYIDRTVLSVWCFVFTDHRSVAGAEVPEPEGPESEPQRLFITTTEPRAVTLDTEPNCHPALCASANIREEKP